MKFKKILKVIIKNIYRFKTEIFNMDVNIFKYEALKKHMGTHIELPEKLQKRSLINIKSKDDYCFIWSYIRHINPQQKYPNRIKIDDKKLFAEIYEKLKTLNFL